MKKKRSLNEIRQVKEYYKQPYQSSESLIKKIISQVKQYPNNYTLGEEVRKLINKINKHE